MTLLLIAGTGVILAGLAAIGFGIPVKEFSFGNTLILTGTIGACTGLIMVSLGVVLREMRRLADQLSFASGDAALHEDRHAARPAIGADGEDDDSDEGASGERELPGREPHPGVPPWQDEVLRDRERLAAAADRSADEPKRHNLLFKSTRRAREQDGGEAAIAQALELDLSEPKGATAPVFPPREDAPARGAEPARTRDEAPRNDPPPANRLPADRPPTDRPRFSDSIRQAARASATHSDRSPDRAGDRLPERSADREGDRLPDLRTIPDRDGAAERAPGVTVLKSGVVDGMAYSLYSDGSIEAQMPEGLMRFASIDDLREHLDHRS